MWFGMTEVKVGKLYLSFDKNLYECVDIGETKMRFRRVTLHHSYVSSEWEFWKNEVNYKIEREATVADIEAAIEDGLDNIESLRNSIDNQRSAIRDLDEWRDRLD